MLIDTHAHLTDTRLDAQKIIKEMCSDGLEKIITVGYDAASSLGAVEFAQKDKDVYAAVGLHPSEANILTDKDFNTVLELAKNPKVVAWGETGLDYHYKNTDRAKQKYWLEKQIDAAKAAKLPLIFHLRDAYADMRQIIEEHIKDFAAGAVMHCFSGSKETAQFYSSLGFYISFAGPITFRNTDYADIIRTVPRDRLLIETDCPYLSPEPFRGRLNEPKHVRFVAMKIAEILNESYQRIEDLTRENSYRLFSKMEK